MSAAHPVDSALNAELCEFLGRAPTPFHAVAVLGDMLRGQGYSQLQEAEEWQLVPGGKYFVTRNQSSIIAWVQGRTPLEQSGWRILGAHTDSPCLRLKPNPDLYRKGCWQFGVEVYGGVLLNPWFDRDLSIAGRVFFKDEQGDMQSALVNFERPMAVVPSLAIHLDREVNNKRSVNAQKHLPVLLGMGESDALPDLHKLLRTELEAAGQKVSGVLDFELSLYDVQPASLVGANQDFIASARLDNLLSCFIDARAMLDAGDEASWPVLVCNDHEEVGSRSAAGAAGPFLQQVLERIAGDRETCARALANSLMISTDNAHAMHPNYSDKMDDEHAPRMNAGPVIKINANQSYASNSETQAHYRALCERLDIPVQAFVVRSDMACGSTIGPITAAELGVKTLDIGVPTLAMHSIRELAGAADTGLLYRSLREFLKR